jgi:hypothetical protein
MVLVETLFLMKKSIDFHKKEPEQNIFKYFVFVNLNFPQVWLFICKND